MKVIALIQPQTKKKNKEFQKQTNKKMPIIIIFISGRNECIDKHISRLRFKYVYLLLFIYEMKKKKPIDNTESNLKIENVPILLAINETLKTAIKCIILFSFR